MDIVKAASARDHPALVREQVLGDVPAAIERLLTRFSFGTATFFEERFTERRLAGDEHYRPRRDARGRHVDEEEGNALLLDRLRVGAHKAEDPVGFVGVGGPDLLPVDEESDRHGPPLSCAAESEIGASTRSPNSLDTSEFRRGQCAAKVVASPSARASQISITPGQSIQMPKLTSGGRA